MKRKATSLLAASAVATVLVALAFAVAPHSCQGGLEIYVASGAVAVALLLGLPFVARLGRSVLVRAGLALGFGIFGLAAWLIGLFWANVRFICGLGYL